MIFGVVLWPFAVLFSLVTIAVAIITFLSTWKHRVLSWFHVSGTDNQKNLRARRMSFLSEALIAGLFPDSGYLHIEHGIWGFAKLPPRDVVVKVVQDNIIGVKQFRRFWSLAHRISSTTLPAEFIELPLQDFHLQEHILEKHCADEDQMRLFVQQMIEEPMDSSKPLWDITRIECDVRCNTHRHTHTYTWANV